MNPEHHAKLKEDISSIVHLSRKISASVRVKINWEELNNMEKTCVIRKTDKTPEWVNLMVVVEKPTGGLRTCMDSGDLSKAIK